ncbi:MAG: T9SS type A sorting domain-containing protein, partial [Ignavibacteria bacterium]
GAGTTDVYEYNPSTGTWTLKAPIPSATQGHGAGNWGDSVIFVIMGPWGIPTTTCQFYRVSNNTTGTTTPFTGSARRSHAVGLWGNKIYVAGGFPFTNTFYIGTIGSNASTISWAAGPNYPSVPKSRIGGVAVGDRFYIIGGNNSIGTTSSDSTFIWNISAGVWSALGSVKPAAVHNNEAAVTYKCVGDTVKIFCPGGSSQAGTTLNFDVLGCGATVVGINPIVSGIPREYMLMQNYPNPFNPSTKITYALPKAGNVKLAVYDILGKEVAVLVNEFKQVGRFTVEFNAKNLSSGAYFYKLEAGDFTDVKKMVILK